MALMEIHSIHLFRSSFRHMVDDGSDIRLQVFLLFLHFLFFMKTHENSEQLFRVNSGISQFASIFHSIFFLH